MLLGLLAPHALQRGRGKEGAIEGMSYIGAHSIDRT